VCCLSYEIPSGLLPQASIKPYKVHVDILQFVGTPLFLMLTLTGVKKPSVKGRGL
jgi:hypothetical protein